MQGIMTPKAEKTRTPQYHVKHWNSIRGRELDHSIEQRKQQSKTKASDSNWRKKTKNKQAGQMLGCH